MVREMERLADKLKDVKFRSQFTHLNETFAELKQTNSLPYNERLKRTVKSYEEFVDVWENTSAVGYKAPVRGRGRPRRMGV